MYTLPTTEARDAVNTASVSSKIIVTKFQMGDFTPNLPNLTSDPDFDVETISSQSFLTTNTVVKYEGNENQIKYNPVALDRVVLKCYAPPQIANTFHYDCVLLFVEYEGEEFIFTFHYYNQRNPKFNIEQTEGGMQYYFLLTIDLRHLTTKFDFSNLVREEVTFLDVEDWYTLPRAHKELKDQGILHKHPNTPNSNQHLIINSNEQWYGTFMVPFSVGDTAKDLTLPMVGDFYPIVDPLPEGYIPYLKEDESPIKDHLGNELMKKVS